MVTRYSSNQYVNALANEYARALRGSSVGAAPAQSPAQSSIPQIQAAQSGLGGKANPAGPDSPVGWILDIIGRTGYGMGGAARVTKDAWDEAKKDGFGSEDIPGLAKAFGPGARTEFVKEMFAPQRREFVSDVAYEDIDKKVQQLPEVPEIYQPIRFAGGLAMDIISDPLTYIPGAAIGKIGSAIGASRVGRAVKGATRTEKVAPRPDVLAAEKAADASDIAEGVSVKQITQGPRQITAGDDAPIFVNREGVARRGVAPDPTDGRPFEVDSAGVAQRSSRTVTDDLLERSVAKDANAIAKGTYVPKVTPENAAANATIKGAEVAEDAAATESKVRRVLVHNKTGKEVPWEQRLANLSVSRRLFPDEVIEKIPPLFTKVDDAPTPAPKAKGKAQPEVTVAKTDEVQSFDNWAQQNRGLVLSSTQATIEGETKTVNYTLGQALRDANSPIAAKAERAIEALADVESNQYARYVAETRKSQQAATNLDSTPTSGTPSVEVAAEQAARARDGANPERWVRKRGEELEAYKQEVSRLITDKSIARTLWSKETMTKEGWQSAIERLRTLKKREPTYTEKIIEQPTPAPKSADDPIAAVQDDIVTAAEQIASPPPPPTYQAVREVLSGQHLSPHASEFLRQQVMLKMKKNPEAWPFVSGRGALRDSEIPGVGKAIWEFSFNAKDQYTIASKLVAHHSRNLPRITSSAKPATAALNRAESVYQAVIKDLDQIDAFVRMHKVQPIATDQAAGLPLSLADTLRAIHDSGSKTARQRLLRRYFTATGGGNKHRGRLHFDTLIMAARTIAEYIPVGTTRKELEAALGKVLKTKGAEAGQRAEKVLATQEVKTFDKGKVVPVSKAEAQNAITEMVQVLMDPRVMTRIVQSVHDNAAMAGIKFGQDVGVVSRATANDLLTALHSPEIGVDEAIRLVDKVDDVVANNAKTAGPAPYPKNVEDAAAQQVKDTLPEVLPLRDVEAVERISKISAAANKGDRAGVNKAAMDGYDKIRAQAFAESPPTVFMHSADNADVAMQAGIVSKVSPLMSKLADAFIPHAGNATIHNILPVAHTRSMGLMKSWLEEMNGVNRMLRQGRISQDDLNAVFRAMQRGEGHQFTGAQAEAYQKMHVVVSQIFEVERVTHTDGIIGGFMREGYDVQHIIDKMTSPMYAMPEKYMFDTAAAAKAAKDWARSAARSTGRMPNKEAIAQYERWHLANQWRSWDVDDPIDFMGRMMKVSNSLATDMSIAQEGFAIARGMGLASTRPIKGYVKIGNPEQSTIARYFPEGYYFDPDIVKEFERVDDILKQSETFTSPFGRFVNRNLDPLLNMWKSGVTVWKPGHHVRNLVGDMSLSFLADGVKNPLYYRRALMMIGMRKSYDGWDALRAMRGEKSLIRPEALNRPGATSTAFKTRLGGREYSMTMEEFNRHMLDRGVLPDFRVQEDLLEGTTNPSIAKLQQKTQLLGGRGKKTVGSISEARDDYVRLAHALHIMEHPPKHVKSIEELLDYAANRVRQWHPDGSDLTGFERKVMRRLFPFYSWMRKALPLVTESILMHPGRVAVFPKATYNFAHSQGIELNSFSDPFPDDQMWPDFLRESSTGPVARNPQGDYLTYKPGFVTNDVLDDIIPGRWWDQDSGADAVRNLIEGPVGMLNPMLKAPVEVLTETNLASGGRVHSIPEYIDSQIPGANWIASISGYSPTGSLLSGGLKPQRQVERGNKEHFEREAFWNYLLGAQLQNVSRPSYINMAEIERRNRIGRQREREAGN